MDQPNAAPAPVRCGQLRCKSMLVYGEAFEEDPEFQAGNVDFWCTMTSKAVGPDGGPVDLADCMDTRRPCHEGFVGNSAG